ncbi:hypothetical protein C8J57DRAFT_1231300 [Mycena rebaudengoi]|nr:hypothetical protein C8J57DRAFT_1231300 [Mycena rebaudengoi]
MQIISSLVAFITLATVRVVAAAVKPVALSPANVAAAGLLNINDFQGFGLNLVNNAAVGPGEGTAVFVFPGSFASFLNQKGSNFHIANGLNSSLFLSYPAAPFNGNPFGAELVVFLKVPRHLLPSTHRFIRKYCPAAPGNSGAPAILAQIDASLQPQQTWTIVAAPEIPGKIDSRQTLFVPTQD